MKVLMINGSPHQFGCTYTALNEVKNTLAAQDIDADVVYLGTKPLGGCMACGYCRDHGECVRRDLVNEVAATLDDYDALIVGSPVYYSGASGQICSFLDRLFYSASAKLTGKPAAAVVSCRRGGTTATFERLNQYFLINSMIVVGSQYWNQVHGNSPDQVQEDEEGLQTMRTLGINMAWVLRSIEAGRNAGVAAPVYEPKVFTNFVRES